MSNELAKVAASQVPDHIRNRFGGGLTNGDLSGGITGGFPVISYKGKVWALVKNGEKQLMLNADGEPRSSIEVVIVKAAPTLSKSYYKSGFEEGTTEAPDCHSFDAVAPSADSPNPQSKACATCPRNVWGSRISDNGKKGRECADVKRLAVADPEDLEEAILLRVPAASLKFLGQFADMLSKRGAPYQAVKTKIGFDPQVAHPQFTFKAPGWLTEEQLDKVEALMNSDAVNRILGLDAASARHAEVVAPPEEDDELGPAPAHISGKATASQPVAKATTTPKAAAAKAKPQVIPTEDEVEQAIVGDEEQVVDLAAARQAKATPKAATPKAQSVDAVIADADEKLADILSSLDDDD